MSENIDVKATITAEDEASPVIRALLRQVRRLEKANFGISADKLKAGLTGAAVAAAKIADAQKARASALRSSIILEGRRQRAETTTGADLRKRLAFESRMQRQKAGEERKAARTAAAVLRVDTANRMRAARADIAAKIRADAQQFRALRQKLQFGARMERQRASEAREIERQDRLRESAHRREIGRIDRENRARRRAFMTTGRASTGALRDASQGLGTTAMLAGGAAAAGGYAVVRRETQADAAEIDSRIYGNLSADQARANRRWARATGVDLGIREADLMIAYREMAKVGLGDADAKSMSILGIKASEGWAISPNEVSEVIGKAVAVQISNGGKFDASKLYRFANVVQHLAKETAVSPTELLSYQKMAVGANKALGMSDEYSLALATTGISQGVLPHSMANLVGFLGARIPQLQQFERQEGEEGKRTRKLMRDLGFGTVAAMNRSKQAKPDRFLFDVFSRIDKLKGPKRNEALQALLGSEWFSEGSAIANGMPAYRRSIALVDEAKRTDALGEMWALHTQKLAFIGKQIDSAFGGLLGSLGELVGPGLKDIGTRLTAWITGNTRTIQVAFYAGLQGLSSGLLGRDGTFNELIAGMFGDIGKNPAGVYEFFRGVGQGLRDVFDALSWIGQAAKEFLLAIGASSPQEVGRLAAQTLGFGMAAKVAAPWVGIAKDAALAIGAGVFTIARLSTMLGGGAAIAGAGAAAGALSLPVLLGIAVVGGALAVAVMNWDGIKEWMGKAFDNSDAARVRRLEDRAAGKEGWLEGVANSIIRAFGGDPAARARQQLGGSIMGGSGQGSTRGYAARDRIVGADLAPAGLPLGGASGGKPMLDAIARAEGTAGRGDYETVLGYGKYGKPSKPITQMSLAEAFAFGRQIKSRHGSSSAIGRYQIVGNTMKDAASALGMDWNTTKFDAATQDRMAEWIRQRQGFGAWEGFKRNPAELATARAAVAGAPTISTAGTALAVNNVRYANTNATRNKRVTDSLQASLSEAVMNAYGPGYTAEIYSGGQDRKGHGHRRTGSTRHDDGRAADVYVYDPRGKRLSGDMLGPIAQEWLARQRGGVGLEMRGGGIHLDEHKDRAKTWDYGPLTPGQRQAVAAGLAGQVPPSAARQAPADLAARVPLPSARPGGPGGGGMGGGGVNISGLTIHAGPGQNPQQIAEAVGREFERRASWTTNDLAHDF